MVWITAPEPATRVVDLEVAEAVPGQRRDAVVHRARRAACSALASWRARAVRVAVGVPVDAPPSTVFETISVAPWWRSAWRIRSLISSGWSIIRPCMLPPREVVYPSAMKSRTCSGSSPSRFPSSSTRRASVHRQHFDPAAVQLSTLLSVKTGGCPEDCAYCPQSRRYRHRGRATKTLLAVDDVLARRAQREGKRRDALLHGRGLARARRTATSTQILRDGRGREGAGPRDLRHARHAQAPARPSGCATRGSTTTTTTSTPRPSSTARSSARAPTTTGSTRSSTCAAPGSTCAAAASSAWASRAATAPALIAQLASLDPHPESVPINALVQVAGTPLRRHASRSIRSSSCAPSPRRASPCRKAWVRLSAGRESMSRGGAGAVLPRRRELDLLRREAAHHRKSRSGPRPRAVRAAGPQTQA